MAQQQKTLQKIVTLYALLLLGLGFLIGTYSDAMPQWYTNWFSSRSYAFFLTTIFLLGAVFLLLPWNWARFVRLPSRRAILLGQAKELYRWAAITVGLMQLPRET